MMDLQTAFDRGFEAVKAYVDDELGRLAARLAGLEVPAAVPPELAEQLKAAASLLETLPPIEQTTPAVKEERPAPVVRQVSGTMITRGGELAVSYSDGTSERLGIVIGPPGQPGPAGRDGADGIGIKGDEGPPGRDGVSIMAAAINRNGELMLTLSDGTVLTPGRVTTTGRSTK